MNESVSLERLDEITDRVFTFLCAGDLQALDERLRNVMADRQRYACMELSMYLRACSSCRDELPTWQPLLNATVELIKMRGEDLEMLYGMLPSRETTSRNTGQPVYKPHQT